MIFRAKAKHSLRFCKLRLGNEFRTNCNPILTNVCVKVVKIGKKIKIFLHILVNSGLRKITPGVRAEYDISRPARNSGQLVALSL